MSLVNFSFPRMFVYSWAGPRLAYNLPSLLPGRSVPAGRELGYSICQRREAEALRLEGPGTKHAWPSGQEAGGSMVAQPSRLEQI